MKTNLHQINRRHFLKKGALTAGALVSLPAIDPFMNLFRSNDHIVSIVRIKNDRIDSAVESAIDLLGGITSVCRDCRKIMLKPNLVSDDVNSTTKPQVVKTLALLMKKAGKEVLIGEGSAAAAGINADENGTYFTRNVDKLEKLQNQVFDKLGYSGLAKEMEVPLVNLHIGDMVEMSLPSSHYFKKLTLHKSLTDIDMLCSIPMMKTHVLAGVTLGLKNVIGLYPGSAYCSVRSCVHNEADQAGSKGVAFEIIDMARANKMGLTVIDGSMAMEGDGPTGGSLVKMDVIIAGTSPLAADMVAASIMGFEPEEIPHFQLAHTSGMHPLSLQEIEIRGEKIENVRRNFVRPKIVPYHSIAPFFGAKEV